MARRMDIELTSSRDDGTWTWRAVGAREPRGVVTEKLLPPTSHVGDVLRVEADFELDGITILSVLPSKQKRERNTTIEIAARPVTGEVTTSLVGRSGRSDRPRREWSLDGPPRRDGARPAARRDGATRTGGPRGDTGRTGAREPGAQAPGGPARAGSSRPAAAGRERRPGGDREHSAARPGAGAGAPSRPAHADAGSGRPTERRRGDSADRPARTSRPRPQRLVPGSVHRDAMLAALPAEHRPVAEQLAAGGLPAVRRALDEQRSAARAEGRASEPGDAMLTLAEQLLPSVREALWLDRAEAAIAKIDAISLRDLRAAVVGGTPRDEHGRALLQQLREALDARVTKLRTSWEGDIGHALDEGRVLQALRLSARPPEPTARFPAALVTRLAESSHAAMTAATPPERWIALLEAAAASPLRRSIRPEGMPEDPTGAVRQAAQLAVGRVPSLAPLLGMTMPPPPRPLPPPPPRTSTARPPAARTATSPAAPSVDMPPADAAAPAAVDTVEAVEADPLPAPTPEASAET